jgi:hypothetical protein
MTVGVWSRVVVSAARQPVGSSYIHGLSVQFSIYHNLSHRCWCMVDGACCVFLFVVLFFGSHIAHCEKQGAPNHIARIRLPRCEILPPRPGRRVSLYFTALYGMSGGESVLSLRSSSRLACATLCLTLIHVQHVCDV